MACVCNSMGVYFCSCADSAQRRYYSERETELRQRRNSELAREQKDEIYRAKQEGREPTIYSSSAVSPSTESRARSDDDWWLFPLAVVTPLGCVLAIAAIVEFVAWALRMLGVGI